MSISTLLRFQRCAYELLGWSGARVMKVFIFVSLFELLRPREVVIMIEDSCYVFYHDRRHSKTLAMSSIMIEDIARVLLCLPS